jgi:hypothetical protein
MRAANLAVQGLAGQPERAAFYLPGLASKACAVLADRSASLPPSAHAACCAMLQDLLSIALDPSTLSASGMRAQNASTPGGGDVSAAAVLAALTHTAAGRASDSVEVAGAQSGVPVEGRQGATSDSAAPFATQRSAAWLAEATAALGKMLPPALDAAAAASTPVPRAAAARLCVALAQRCARTLPRELLRCVLRCALRLAHDAAPRVAAPWHEFARAVRSGGRGTAAVAAELAEISAQAADALRGGSVWSEGAVEANAGLLAVALRALPPQQALAVAGGPAELLELLCTVLEFDLAAAELWLQGHSRSGAATGALVAVRAPVGRGADSRELRSVATLSEPADGNVELGDSADTAVAGKQGAARADGMRMHVAMSEVVAAARALHLAPQALQGGVQCARAFEGIPFGLRHLQQEGAFQAVAGVAAALGEACAAIEGEQVDASSGGMPLRAGAHAGSPSSATWAAVEFVRTGMQDTVPSAARRDAPMGATSGPPPPQRRNTCHSCTVRPMPRLMQAAHLQTAHTVVKALKSNAKTHEM